MSLTQSSHGSVSGYEVSARALWSIYGGLINSVGLIVLSPVVSGRADPATGASLPLIGDTHVNFAFFPLDNPGIVSIPLGFFLGWLGSATGRPPADPAWSARMRVRAPAGVGAERGDRG
jgi:cation/acetate symporter